MDPCQTAIAARKTKSSLAVDQSYFGFWTIRTTLARCSYYSYSYLPIPSPIPSYPLFTLTFQSTGTTLLLLLLLLFTRTTIALSTPRLTIRKHSFIWCRPHILFPHVNHINIRSILHIILLRSTSRSLPDPFPSFHTLRSQVIDTPSCPHLHTSPSSPARTITISFSHSPSRYLRSHRPCFILRAIYHLDFSATCARLYAPSTPSTPISTPVVASINCTLSLER